MPIGVGFSYNKAKTVDNSKTAASHFIRFLANILNQGFKAIANNPIYLAGEGYAAHYITEICEQLSNNKYDIVQT